LVLENYVVYDMISKDTGTSTISITFQANKQNYTTAII